MSLSELPRTFGEEEISKGYFPHLFNRKENHNKVFDNLPDIKFYNPDSMKPEWRTEFMNWYSQHKDDLFDFNKELLRYCKSDVDILRICCLKFRKMFMEITTRDEIKGIDSFEKCITIASVCNLVYMTLYLESERIGIIPPHGYRPEQTQSIKALHWLKYISKRYDVNIQHAFNGGEKQIGLFKVDGYRETTSSEKIA
jgi:hypothetical protein